MRKRIFARRLLALTLAYAVALQTLLPFALATAQGSNAVICVKLRIDQSARRSRAHARQ